MRVEAGIMKRQITQKLLNWKDDRQRKPLLLTGVRQCGKTYILEEFGREYFDSYLYINFERQTYLADVFEYDLDPQRIMNEIAILMQKPQAIPGKTLVIFDEIQACPKAVTSLKYFCEDMPQLHLVAAGSLLGVALKQEEISFPVGKVDRLRMYPMNFEEFVCAKGADNYLELIRSRDQEAPLPDAVREPMEKLLKEYYIVGGMPEIVQSWITDRNIDEVERLQEEILESYRNDFSKHAPLEMVPKLNAVWDSIPVQLAKDNNKFVFSHIKQSARAREYEDALQWLIDAGLVYRPEMVEKPSVPLSFCADASYFKVYFADVGLMRKKAGVYYRQLLEKPEQYTPFTGSLAENYVFEELVSQDLPIWFYRSGNDAEVDVLTEYTGLMIPIEVKSADNTRAKSYRNFCETYQPKIGFKMSLKNIGISNIKDTVTVSLPLYLSFRIKEYIDGLSSVQKE